jgi:hypothetical protein
MSTLPADDLIATAAFRYALGRQSYMVEHVASWLRRNKTLLPKVTRDLIVREVHEARDRNGLGMDCDASEWMSLAATFEEQ